MLNSVMGVPDKIPIKHYVLKSVMGVANSKMNLPNPMEAPDRLNIHSRDFLKHLSSASKIGLMMHGRNFVTLLNEGIYRRLS
jgi:hypothetical protein